MAGLEAPVQREILDVMAGLGWQIVERIEMNAARRGRMDDAVVEPLLLDAIQTINDGVSQADAAEVAAKVRRITDPEEFQRVIRDGITVALAADEPEQTVVLVDWLNPERNSFVVTPEFEVRAGVRHPRLDVVGLVNGLPLALIEAKAETESWKKAAGDFRGYWVDAPQLATVAAFCVATNGIAFRYAPGGATRYKAYGEWKDTWPEPIPAGMESDEFALGCRGLLRPAAVCDIAANFVVFEERDGHTTRKVARYQQFRAANKIVQRVLGGELDRGIIWHTQGSGKSLTMVFAARKLMRVGLSRPTVLVVVDRTDLDTQINETLEACGFEGVQRATSREDLGSILASDQRGVIVTTVHKFQEQLGEIQDRENVVVFVDEAHRSQEGELGIWMRAALPSGKLFAFTGTPVETADRSTRRAFSPLIAEDTYERYLDVYGIQQAILDGATVPITYERRLVEWAVQKDDLDEAFAKAFGHLDPEEQAILRREGARRSVIAKAPKRVTEIAGDVADFLKARIAPNGFKAQLVATDREACAGYADELAGLLEPNEYAVAYHFGGKDDGEELRHWYPGAQWKRTFAAGASGDEPGAGGGDVAAFKALVKRFKDPADPLKLLIVNNMLLTGFDAPIEQVLFLDRELRAHNLLQAIARTNRPADGKEYGIVVDYWGVFSQLEAALGDFDTQDIGMPFVDPEEIRAAFAQALAEALAMVAGMPPGKSDREQMAWLVHHFQQDADRARAFKDRVKAVQGLFETLAPEPILLPYLDDYRRVITLYAVWLHGSQQDDDTDVAEYLAHTRELVHDAISIERLRTDLPVYRVDEGYLTRLGTDEDPLTPEEKSALIESAIVHEIKVRGDRDPLAVSLAKRLRELHARLAKLDQATIDRLAEYQQLLEDWLKEKQAREDLGLSDTAFALLAAAREASGDVDVAAATQLATTIDERFRKVERFAGWDRDLQRDLTEMLALDPGTRPLLATNFVDEAITLLADEEAADAALGDVSAASPAEDAQG